MIEGIIHNSLGEANSLNTRVHARMMGKKRELKYNATSFFAVIKHPTKNKWVSIIKRNTGNPIWAEALNELSPGEIDKIEEITSDWFVSVDIDDEEIVESITLVGRVLRFMGNIFKSS